MAFFRKKEKPMTISEEKMKADENRTRSEEIKNALMAADMIRRQIAGRPNTYPFSRENLQRYGAAIDALVRTLDNQHASIADTEMIDVTLKNLALKMADDFKMGNAETVDYDLRALTYGVTKAKSEIYSEDKEYIRRVMDTRREYLTRYEGIIRFAQQLDEINRSNGRYTEALNSTEKEYEKANKVMVETFQQNPGLQEELDKLKVGKPVSSEVMSFSNLRNQVVNLFNDKKHINSSIALNRQEYASCLNAIKTIKVQMSKMENLLDDELIEEMRKTNEEYLSFLNEQQDRMNAIQNISNEFHNIMISVTSSRKLIDNIIDNEERYKKMMRELEEKEAADERGRKILQEQQAEQKENMNAHDDQTIILN